MIKEHDDGLNKKSSLDNFAEKYVIGGKLGFKSRSILKKAVSNILTF